MIKKKVLFHTDYCGHSTGFGGFAREILEYLQRTGKYELFLYAGGSPWESPDYQKWPWKVFGAIPNNQQEIHNWLSQFPSDQQGVKQRDLQYGSFYLDKVIDIVKPHVYIFNQDFWGGNYALDRKWWNKINCIFNWTADSRPLLEDAQQNAHKIKHHYVWADFAVKEFKRLAKEHEDKLKLQEQELLSRKFNSEQEKQQNLNGFESYKKQIKEKIDGFNRVKLLRGTVNTKSYKKLSNSEKLELRKKLGIKKEDFCIGTLSRNQLRKLWPNLLEGYKLFKQQNPQIKNTKLLFFTHFGEGWDIPRLMRELDLDPNEILACYKCKKTRDFFVLPFTGQDIDNPTTGDKKTLVTVSIGDSLTNEQVNQWYNLLDVFCLPITSGGQERAAQEAKLCELITIINPYSCFEDSCVEEAYSLPIDQSFNREIGSQFIKASPYPSSIAKQIKKVYEMPENKRIEWGKKAREWTLNNFSIEVIGKQYEELIDSLPEVTWDFTYPEDIKNPSAQIPDIQDDYEFINFCYKNILNMHDMVKEKDEVRYWLNHLNQPKDKNQLKNELVNTFRQVAAQKNAEQQKITLEDLLDKTDKERVLLVLKESLGDAYLITSLLPEIQNKYPLASIYLAIDPKYNEVFEMNQYIKKCIPWSQEIENELYMCGQAGHKGFFNYFHNIGLTTQRSLNYLSASY